MAQKSLWQPSDIQNADSNEAEAPKRRGRIPQSAWPRILERHRAGATLSAIAREFDCTPSAISYIIRKAEAAGVPSESGEAGEAPDAPVTPEETAPEARAEEQPQAEAGEEAPAAAPAEAPEPPPAKSEARGETRTRTGTGTSGRSRLGLTPPAGAETRIRGARKGDEQPAAATPPEERPVEARVAEQPMADEAAPARNAAQPAGRSEPVDAIEARLRDTARSCLVAYRAWRQQPGEGSIQGLSDAMHELRKALARIEIEMSASRREEQALRPIPIPAHRAARRPR